MKKIISLALAVLTFTGTMSFIYYQLGYYTKENCVAYDAHTFEDRSGNLWEVNDTLVVGAKYDVKMHDGTLAHTNIDDVVVSYIMVE